MKIKRILFGFLSFMMLFSISCRKGEGLGGKATIKGKVYEKLYNATGTFILKEYYLGDEDVYIVYGDNDFYDDKVATHYDGTYKFEYLMPGKYTLYVYSKDVTGSGISPQYVVKQEVTITQKDQVVTLEDFIIYDN